MITRQKLVTFGIPTLATGTVVLAALLSPWSGRGYEAKPPIEIVEPSYNGTQIDVVFAVDTTGSMGGLLDGAKRTVWSIANHIRKSDANANIRIGLVANRDVGDDYITKDFALTTDLDAAFAELSSFQADGGGDVFGVGRVHIGDLDAELVENLVVQPGHPAVHIIAGDDVIARFEQAGDGIHGGHAGRV